MRTLWVLGWWNLTRNGTRDLDEIVFNKKFSSARVQEECAFSMMKNRWGILQKRFDSNIEFTIKAAIACAALHSIFCEITMHGTNMMMKMMTTTAYLEINRQMHFVSG